MALPGFLSKKLGSVAFVQGCYWGLWVLEGWKTGLLSSSLFLVGSPY